MNKEEKKTIINWLKKQNDCLNYKFVRNRVLGYIKGTKLIFAEFYPRVILEVIKKGF